jgi:hypothetical protein
MLNWIGEGVGGGVADGVVVGEEVGVKVRVKVGRGVGVWVGGWGVGEAARLINGISVGTGSVGGEANSVEAARHEKLAANSGRISSNRCRIDIENH